MSQTEKSTAEAEEIILDAEVLSEESPNRPTSNLPKLILLNLVGFAALGGAFWKINQELNLELHQQDLLLQQQTEQAAAQGAQNSQTIQNFNGQLSQLTTEIKAQRTITSTFDQKLAQQQQGFERVQSRTESSLQQQEQTIQQLIDNNREQSHLLNLSVSALSRRVDQREDNLHTAAALRLLQIAEEQLMIVHDLRTTQQALAQASQQISASGDPILLPIYEQILNELKQVRETETPDLPAALAQLRKAIDLSAALSFNQPAEFSNRSSSSDTATDVEWNWRSISEKVWRDLLTLVRIDKQESELPIIATRSEEHLSRMILRLRLEQAQSTLLMRDTALFRERVEYAMEWLSVFDQSSSAAQTLQQQLSALLSLELQPDPPTIGEAHRRLREIIILRNTKPVATEPAEEAPQANTSDEAAS